MSPTQKKTINTTVISTLSIVASVVMATFYLENKVRDIVYETIKPFVQKQDIQEKEFEKTKNLVEYLKPVVYLTEFKVNSCQAQIDEFIKPEKPERKKYR